MADPNPRQRARQAKAAARLLDPSTTHIDYIAARGHARLGAEAMIIGGAFLAVFLIALTFGYLIFPGFLAIIFVVYSTIPPRGVVVANQGVAVLNRSIWNNQPNRIITLLTHEQMAQVQASAKGSKALMQFGPERLTFSKKEWARFTAAVQQVSGNWTGNVHLSAPGGLEAGAPGGPIPMPAPPGSPSAQGDITGLPPIPGVDAPRHDAGLGGSPSAPPSPGAPFGQPGAGGSSGATEF